MPVSLYSSPASLHSTTSWPWGDESWRCHFLLKGVHPAWSVADRGVGDARQTVDGEGEELSWSQCSSSIDSLSWWKETFQCSCSPLSLSSMPMTSLLTSRCSPSTTPMSSRSSLKVSWLSLFAVSIYASLCFLYTDGWSRRCVFLTVLISAVHGAKQVHSGGCHWSSQATVLCWHVSYFFVCVFYMLSSRSVL